MIESLVCWDYLDQPALLDEDGRVVTYAELKYEISEFSLKLDSRKLVFLVGQNDIASIVAYLACLNVGAVPLLLDKSLSWDSVQSLLQVYLPEFFFLSNDSFQLSDAYEPILSLPGSGRLYKRIKNFSTCTLDPHQNLALLLATSGSTGSPKLVRLSGVNLCSNAKSIAQYLGIKKSDRAITSLSFGYSYGMSVINSHLKVAASISLTKKTLFDPGFWQQLKSQSVTSLAGVPYSYEIFLKLKIDRMILPSLLTLIQAGGHMDASTVQHINRFCQSNGIKFYIMYGQTEASPRISYLPPEEVERKIGSVGRAIPGGRLWLEDEDGSLIKAPGQVGELIYSGPNVALGYAETRFDLSRGDDWGQVLRTGDLARRDEDGYFYIVGRKNRFLKIFGLRISLDTVEAWFSERGVMVAAYGEDGMLYVSAESDETTAIHNLFKDLLRALRIHPSAVELRFISKLPRLASGKVNYQCLRTLN